MSQHFSKLFSSWKLGNITLSNRIVMAPMTRSRAIGNIPNDLMAAYYAARAGAGLIITEGTSPSPNGLGYARIPGIYSEAQIAGWKKVTDAVHNNGGHIFVQMMHTGRITHPLNLPADAEVIGASAIAAGNTPMWTDQEGMKELPVPKEVATNDIPALIEEFVHGAKSAVAAGFDGVELHGANGYLLEQFLNSASNQRTDQYGGSIENRNRFVLEVAAAVADAIGKEKTAIRLSPFGVNGEMVSDATTVEQYTALAQGLEKIGVVYIHVVDHSALGAPAVPDSVKDAISKNYAGTIIISGGYDAGKAEADLEAGKGALVAFGRPFISNPDLVERLRSGAELETPDHTTFYTPGEKGYTDYKVLAVV
jgi:N-ethylmaleimide reductase